jgi:predicted CXXCH cytochrome family protein
MFRKLAGLTAVAGLFIAGTASAQITGSVHDFRPDIGGTDLCAFCHVPHAADSTISEAPLWDHALSSKTYTLVYSSGTMDAAMDTDVATYGISRLCLSCHDGVTAVDSYGGNGFSGTNTMQSVTAWQSVGQNYQGTDISQEHPVSVPPTDAEVRDTPNNPTLVKYFGGQVECASCHDVHDQSGQPRLLVMDNAGSALCLSCHIK